MRDVLVYTIPSSKALCVTLSLSIGDGKPIGSTVVVPVSGAGTDTVICPAEGNDEQIDALPRLPALAFCAIELLCPRRLTVELTLFTVVLRRRF